MRTGGGEGSNLAKGVARLAPCPPLSASLHLSFQTFLALSRQVMRLGRHLFCAMPCVVEVMPRTPPSKLPPVWTVDRGQDDLTRCSPCGQEGGSLGVGFILTPAAPFPRNASQSLVQLCEPPVNYHSPSISFPEKLPDTHPPLPLWWEVLSSEPRVPAFCHCTSLWIKYANGEEGRPEEARHG